MKKSIRHWVYYLPDLTIVVIALAYIFMSAFITRIGDDVHYSKAFDSLSSFLDSIPHTYAVNGRTSTYLAQLVLNLSFPRPLLALLNGIGIASLFYASFYAANLHRNNYVIKLSLILALLVFPGWDFLWNEWCAIIIYEWCAGIAVWLIAFALRPKKQSLNKHSNVKNFVLAFAMFIAGMITGGFNEALGLTFIVAIPLTLLFCPIYRHSSLPQKATLAGLFTGSFIPFLSPYLSNHTNIAYHFSPWEIIFTSGWPMILLIASAILLFSRRKKILYKLINSSWIFFFIASALSLPGIILAGYPGRPAWYGQLFSIIALVQLWKQLPIAKFNCRNSSSMLYVFIAITLSLTTISHITAVAHWQYVMGSESRLLIKKIEAPAQSTRLHTVYLDYTDDTDLPWYVLGKTRGVPDHDDVIPYLRDLYYGYNFGIPVAILPVHLENISYKEIRQLSPFRMGKFIISDIPLSESTNPTRYNYHAYALARSQYSKIVYIKDTLYIESPFPVPAHRSGPSNAPVAFIYTPVSIDPGQF